MAVLHEWCGGLEVHAKTVGAGLSQKGRKASRTFSTLTDEVVQWGEWLTSAGCPHGAMERTGVYGKPRSTIVEGRLTVLLGNARHSKAVPGRKTEVRDCEG